VPSTIACRSMAKGPAQEQVDTLEKTFGREHFEYGRILLTVARDLPGVMKVAHKLQTRITDSFGGVVEVVMEHVKLEWWRQLHETTSTMAMHKGEEVPECQVMQLPDGIRVHPYKRAHMPTLEALLLWEDVSGTTKGHCLFSIEHPEYPAVDQVDDIFALLAPVFAKRWLVVELGLAPPVRGEFDDGEYEVHDSHVGGGSCVTVLACHAYGFAREHQAGVASVTECQPMTITSTTDDAGRAKLCFLPAQINKVQVAETERYHGTEVTLISDKMRSINEGPTLLKLELTPKTVASVSVHVFVQPDEIPTSAEENDGIIDWAAEDRLALTSSQVEAIPLKEGEPSVMLKHAGGDVFSGGLPEGCVTFSVKCRGHEEQQMTFMLLTGTNDFYIPLRKL